MLTTNFDTIEEAQQSLQNQGYEINHQDDGLSGFYYTKKDTDDPQHFALIVVNIRSDEAVVERNKYFQKRNRIFKENHPDNAAAKSAM